MKGQLLSPKEGDRIRLTYCLDPHIRLEPGSLGTARFVDSLGTVHVRWDDGTLLSLIPGQDRWELVAAGPNAAG